MSFLSSPFRRVVGSGCVMGEYIKRFLHIFADDGAGSIPYAIRIKGKVIVRGRSIDGQSICPLSFILSGMLQSVGEFKEIIVQ